MSEEHVNWFQEEISLPAMTRGCHLITDRIKALPAISNIDVGLLHLFLLHTSASLTINENADPDVRDDLEMAMSKLVREDFPYSHTAEGPDDMPAHVKASMMGPGLTIPISKGQLCLGTWQGIYLWEHRNHGGRRRIVVTIQGRST